MGKGLNICTLSFAVSGKEVLTLFCICFCIIRITKMSYHKRMFMYYQSNVNECALEIKDGKIFVLYYTLYICIEFSIFENLIEDVVTLSVRLLSDL